MKKNVKIKIVRKDYVEGKFQETMNVCVEGTYYEKDNLKYLFCGAFDENEDGKSKHRITFNNERVELMTSGDLSYCLTYHKGRVENFEYSTPYGNIMAYIYTRNIEVRDTGDLPNIKIHFHTLMDENEGPRKDNESSILIQCE